MYLLGVSSSSVSSGYNMIIKIFPEYLILVVKMLCCNYFSLTWWINPLPTCISKAKQFVFIPEVIPLSACLITLPRLIHSCTFFFSTSRTSRRPLASSNFFIDPVQHEIKILIPFGHLPSTTIIGVQYDFIYVVIYSGSLGWWVRGRVLEWTVLYFILEYADIFEDTFADFSSVRWCCIYYLLLNKYYRFQTKMTRCKFEIPRTKRILRDILMFWVYIKTLTRNQLQLFSFWWY